ncbi:MAG: hypothetical protein U0521_15285 [Anaerolineae bacterium]
MSSSRVFYDAKLSNKQFQIILGTSNGWLPYYYMGVRAMIAGMNNWAPEIITALVKATQAGDVARSEKLYVAMMNLSASGPYFTDSTIASLMALYAQRLRGGLPAQADEVARIRQPARAIRRSPRLEAGFAEAGVTMMTSPDERRPTNFSARCGWDGGASPAEASQKKTLPGKRNSLSP